MRICCLSDSHGFTPDIEDCDLVLHAGDFTHSGKNLIYGLIEWNTKIFPWLKRLSQRTKIVACLGNHDLIGEAHPEIFKQCAEYDIELIEHGWTTFNDLVISATSWTPRFFDWAYNADSDKLKRLYAQLPPCDILLSHTIPYGIMDPGYKEAHVGSRELLDELPLLKPRLMIGGHLHGGAGLHLTKETLFVNASIVDEQYQLVREPIYLEFA